jgi:hypothetical protein
LWFHIKSSGWPIKAKYILTYYVSSLFLDLVFRLSSIIGRFVVDFFEANRRIKEVQMKLRNGFIFSHSSSRHKRTLYASLGLAFGLLCLIEVFPVSGQSTPAPDTVGYDEGISRNAQQMLAEGKQTFRFDTFGDEAFWGDTLKLHEAVAKLSPKQARRPSPKESGQSKALCPKAGSVASRSQKSQKQTGAFSVSATANDNIRNA